MRLPGGSVSAGLDIYDTMRYVKCDVCTYCVGMAASMGAVLLLGGAAGKRYALQNSRVLMHQPLIPGMINGTASDLEIFRMAWALYSAEAWAEKPVRLIGVGIAGWEKADKSTADLFGTVPNETLGTEDHLDQTLDAISNKFGRRMVQRGLRRTTSWK